MRWFHGGEPGRSQGDLILPASELGIRAAADYIPPAEGDTSHIRRDRVYITCEMSIAAAYASLHPDEQDRGWVYEVVPIGPIEPDPDYLGNRPDESRQCERARVRKVYRLSRRDTRILRAHLLRQSKTGQVSAGE